MRIKYKAGKGEMILLDGRKALVVRLKQVMLMVGRTYRIRNLAIFSTSLIFGFVLLSTFAPIIASNASDSNTKVSTEVKPVIAIAAEPEVNFGNITPTNNGTFASKPVETLVGTNATKGFELYFSSKDEATDMKNTNTSISDVVSSTFTGSVTESTMPKNAWGYSLNNTDFNPIPKKSEQKQIKNITTLPTAQELKTIIHFGTKISTNLTAGDYEKSVIFTAVAHDNPRPRNGIFTISKMQQMTPSICDGTTTPKKEATQLDTDGSHQGDDNYAPRTTLTDTRDNSTYTVTKLADGKCWMTQNLRIVNKVITPADSDVTSNYTVPASSSSGFTVIDISSAYVDSTYGGYYNWYTATAGTGMESTPAHGYAPSSICSKGWRLPTEEEIDGLMIYGNAYKLRASPTDFESAGWLYQSTVRDQNNNGNYWSSRSDAVKAGYTYQLYLTGGGAVYPKYEGWKGYGYSVRCIAR